MFLVWIRNISNRPGRGERGGRERERGEEGEEEGERGGARDGERGSHIICLNNEQHM